MELLSHIYDSDRINIKPIITGGGQEYGLRSGYRKCNCNSWIEYLQYKEIQNRVMIMRERFYALEIT